MDVAEFLLARITEDRVRATLRTWHDEDCEHIPRLGSEYTYPCDCGVPERLLAECEAKRRIVEEFTQVHADYQLAHTPTLEGQRFGLMKAMSLLALPYSDHPDYREEWRP